MSELLAVLEALPDATFVLDEDFRVVHANEAARELLGYACAEVVGKSILGLVAHEDAPRVEATFMEARAERVRTRLFRLVLQRRDRTFILVDAAARSGAGPGGGTRIVVTLRVAPGGAPAGWGILGAGGELGRLGMLFEAVPVGVFVTDPERRILGVNAALCALLGYSREELQGRRFDEVTHADDIARSVEVALALRRGEVPSIQLQKRYVARDGRTVWGNLHATAVRPSPTSGFYTFGIVEDITHFKAGEAHLGQRMAMQRRALVRDIHHRIKNSLQGVVGLLTQHAHDNPSCEEPLGRAIDRIHAVALVHGMCASHGSLSPNCCELTTAIGMAMREQHDHPVVTSIAGCEEPLPMHSEELVPYALILTELIANAIKHGRSPTHPVLVELLRQHSGVVINVVTPEAALPAGFDFRRGLGIGTGLGLVKSLMPPRGMQLDLFGRGREVVARLCLEPPIIAPAAQPLRQAS